MPQRLGWSPDGSRIAWGSDDDTGAIADAASGAIERAIANGFAIAWSSDGALLAVAGYAGTLRLLNAASGDAVWIGSGLNGTRAIAWDGLSGLAIAGEDRVLIVEPFGERPRICHGHSGRVLSVAWSGDRGLLASAAADRTVRLWSADAAEELARLEHEGVVWQATFNPGGEWLISVCEDGRIRLWDVAAALRRSAVLAEDLAAYVSRQALTVGFRVRSSVQPRSGGGPIATLQGDAARGYPRAAFCGRGVVASGHPDGSVRLWRTKTGERIWTSDVRRGNPITALGVSPQGDWVLAASAASIAVFATTTGGFEGSFNEHTDRVNDVQWGRQLHSGFASASFDGTVRRWRLSSRGKPLVYEHGSRVTSVTWSDDDTMIASASGELVHLWNAADGKLTRSLGVKGERIWYVRWSPDGQRVAAACGGSFVRIWHIESPTEAVVTLKHGGLVSSLEWSPDGMTIATTSFDRTIRVWDALTGNELLRFTSLRDYNRSVSWSDDGRMLATCGPYDSIFLWGVTEFAAFEAEARPLAPRDAATRSLPSALAQLYRLHIHTPLSLLHGVLKLIAGDPVAVPLERLARLDGIRALTALGWPSGARVGLAALLLQPLPLDGWKPPADVQPAHLRDAVARALLVGEAVQPEPPVIPTEALAESAERIDERLLTLLEIIGPQPVARDPGLPLRLLPRLGQLRPLYIAQRERLGLRLPLGSSGRASGSGLGGERGGFDLRGDLRALLPSQLILPSDVLKFRHLRGELLYRAALGEEPPLLRPTVLVLDISPATAGPVETVTRLAAHILARTLIEGALQAVLVTSGGVELVRVLARVEDLVDIWTQRTNEMPDAGRTLKVARAVSAQISGDGLKPIILVLSHVWFGAGERLPVVPGLRGLFVQYPKHDVKPALAASCEHWASITSGDSKRLPWVLCALIR